MQLAVWMVLAAAMLPYVTVAAAKSRADYNNAAPRDFLAGLQGWRARADWAHRNHFEAFAPFAAGVILAEIAHASQSKIDRLACAFVALRVLYTAVYLAGLATLRSLVWFAGVVVVVWLFVLAAA